MRSEETLKMVIMYEKTGLCPHTEVCQSYKTIINSQHWMQRSLAKLRGSESKKLLKNEGGYSTETLQSWLEKLKTIKNRCYAHHGRCLRYWQFEKKKEESEALSKIWSQVQVERDYPTITVHQQTSES